MLLFRRNTGNDRDKALNVVLQGLKGDYSEVPDMLCLAGRIYKDKFVLSNYEDTEATNQAIHW